MREDPAGDDTGSSALQEAADRLARAGGSEGKSERMPKKAGPVKLGAGLSAVPAILARKIRRGEYVDFAELPPALPEGSSLSTMSSDQLLIVQAADYRRTRRRVPDLTTWTTVGALSYILAPWRPETTTKWWISSATWTPL